MATDLTISDHSITQFTGNVEMLLQQTSPRLLPAVTTGSYRGEKAQAVVQFGEVEMSSVSPGMAVGQWRGDTVWDDIEHFNRWVFPLDYKVALPVARPEEIRRMGDPKSPYVEACRAAYARTVDDTIIAAATSDAKTGRYDDLVNTPLPVNQIIDHDFVRDGLATSSGLTIDKLIAAREKLVAAGNDPGEVRYFACSEKQLSDLLASTQVQSIDYNTVKALVRGELDTFLGFKFISTERLLKTDAAGPLSQIRHCLAWVQSGLHFGTWNGLEVFMDRRPDKNYVWQVYMRATIGATRTQEKKVVQVDCAE